MTLHRLWPILTFLFICVVGYGARTAIGTVYGSAEAIQLLNALSRAGLYLGSAVATAAATTLALMLTLIGTMRQVDNHFDTRTYKNVEIIAMLATASLMWSLVVLLAFVLPVGEFENLPPSWYKTLYEVLFAGSVVMVAMIASTVMMVYITLRRVLASITPGEDV